MEQFAPKLPLNTLDNALAVYKEWLRPLLTDSEFVEAEKIIADFGKNQAPQLAQKLQAYFETLEDNKNWMASYWTKMYLGIRDSLLTESNYALHLTPFANTKDANNLAFMAHWVKSVGAVYQQLKTTPSKTYDLGGNTFCDLNTHNLLGCTRIPSANEDKWLNYPEFLTNIAVFYKNQCFVMPIFDAKQKLLSGGQIASQLLSIKQSQGEANCDFVAYSFHGSDQGAKFLAEFLQDPINQQSFEALNKTIFHIVLTDENFTASQSQLMDILFTLPHTRWCYKPVTFLMWSNNQISAHMEHTGADGITMMRILQLAKDHFLAQALNQIKVENIKAEGNYQRLNWNYSKAQALNLSMSYVDYCEKVQEYGLKIYDFDATSPNFAKVSRDALAQILMQYGMHKITNLPKSIYSACTMGHYREGRTEALRTVSSQIQALVKDIESTHQLNPELLNQALAEHKNRIKLCKQGKAPTRYLSGLNWLSEGKASSMEFYNNPLLARLGENFFSTSNIGTLNDLCSMFLFSPPVPSRYGFGYLINQETIRFCISYHQADQTDLNKMIAGFDEFYQYTK